MNDTMTGIRPLSPEAMLKISRGGIDAARKVLYTVLTVLFAFLICGTATAQHKNFILVIDPGHGGADPGATHGRSLEKDLNLEVALSLGALITREVPGVDVLYTRTDDRAIGLADRGNFANRAGADLFVSIHANANKNSSPNGSETFVMGADKNQANLEVAKLENEVIRYEEDYTETYAAFDPNSTEMSIIFGMMQYAHFESSLDFARTVQKHFAADTPLRDRGAKQGPFAVLWKPTMPRVLVEMGFISNDADRRYMFSEKGKAAIVKVLFDSFREYKAEIDRNRSVPMLAAATPPPATTQTPAATPPQTTPVAAPVQTAPQVTAAQPPAATTPAPVVVQTPPAADETRPAPVTPATTAPDRVFNAPPVRTVYIQLAASRTKVSTDDARWAPYSGQVVERTIDGWYKYALGPYTQSEANAKLGEVRRTKFRDAFIVK